MGSQGWQHGCQQVLNQTHKFGIGEMKIEQDGPANLIVEKYNEGWCANAKVTFNDAGNILLDEPITVYKDALMIKYQGEGYPKEGTSKYDLKAVNEVGTLAYVNPEEAAYAKELLLKKMGAMQYVTDGHEVKKPEHYKKLCKNVQVQPRTKPSCKVIFDPASDDKLQDHCLYVCLAWSQWRNGTWKVTLTMHRILEVEWRKDENKTELKKWSTTSGHQRGDLLGHLCAWSWMGRLARSTMRHR